MCVCNRALPKLSAFTGLKTLVLDKNELVDLDKLPMMPTLQNLWLNDNKVRADRWSSPRCFRVHY